MQICRFSANFVLYVKDQLNISLNIISVISISTSESYIFKTNATPNSLSNTCHVVLLDKLYGISEILIRAQDYTPTGIRTLNLIRLNQTTLKETESREGRSESDGAERVQAVAVIQPGTDSFSFILYVITDLHQTAEYGLGQKKASQAQLIADNTTPIHEPSTSYSGGCRIKFL